MQVLLHIWCKKPRIRWIPLVVAPFIAWSHNKNTSASPPVLHRLILVVGCVLSEHAAGSWKKGGVGYNSNINLSIMQNERQCFPWLSSTVFMVAV